MTQTIIKEVINGTKTSEDHGRTTTITTATCNNEEEVLEMTDSTKNGTDITVMVIITLTTGVEVLKEGGKIHKKYPVNKLMNYKP